MVIRRTIRLNAMLNASRMSRSPGGIGMIITEIIPMTDSAKSTSVYSDILSKNAFIACLQTTAIHA